MILHLVVVNDTLRDGRNVARFCALLWVCLYVLLFPPRRELSYFCSRVLEYELVQLKCIYIYRN